MRTFRKHGEAEPGSSGRKRKTDNFKLALGMGSNFVDLDRGVTYMIQEYAEAIRDPKIPKDRKPTKIRVVSNKTGNDVEWIDEWMAQERMKDPEPDPRY